MRLSIRANSCEHGCDAAFSNDDKLSGGTSEVSASSTASLPLPRAYEIAGGPSNGQRRIHDGRMRTHRIAPRPTDGAARVENLTVRRSWSPSGQRRFTPTERMNAIIEPYARQATYCNCTIRGAGVIHSPRVKWRLLGECKMSHAKLMIIERP
jgi:hypothetical protein